MRGCWANQKPTSTPEIEPMAKASIASTSVIQRCFQIVPSTNHLTMRCTTSIGVEKKNGGSSGDSPTGIVVSACHATTETTATSNCSERSLIFDTIKLLPSFCQR